MLVLERVLDRKDVCFLINEITNNLSYQNKDGRLFLKYNCSYQALFTLYDALFKYCIIIKDVRYLDNYVLQVGKMFRKFNNIYDIEKAINILIINICSEKLGISDRSSYSNKKMILRYIYERYINDGYLFHGFSGIYKDVIERDGFVPEEYYNNYAAFVDIDKIFSRHKIYNIMNKKFYNSEIYLTDNFSNACFYGANSPMYFYHLLCDNIVSSTNQSSNLYLKNDYYGCFKNLGEVIKKTELNSAEKKFVMKSCLEEWKLLNKNTANINVLLVKRRLFGYDRIDFVEDILNNDRDFVLNDAIFNLLYCNNDRIPIKTRINSRDIEFVLIPNHIYKYSIKKNNALDDELSNAYGKASILALLGSIFITLGVIVTIIMFIGGK